MRKATFIIPVLNASGRLNETLNSIIAQCGEEAQIICLVDSAVYSFTRESAARDCASVMFLKSDFKSEGVARILNRGISLSEGDVIFFITQPVILLPGLVDTYIKNLLSHESIGYVYGNFIEETGPDKEVVREVKTDNFDYSEASQIGPVRAIKREVLDAVGYYDSGLKHSFDYDLRLRIFERFEITRVEELLYKVTNNVSEARSNDPVKPLYCYIPSNDNPQNYSYLQYNHEEEKEYRESCFGSLKRRGAFLTHSSIPVECNHGDTNGPQVSVIIPLYNRAEYIGGAIESVLNGAWKDFEIIIVDNGSSDGSVGAVEKYLNEGNITLLKIKATNTAGALNLGIRHARGKYICQLDSDDLYTPKTLGTLYSYMESNPGSALGVSYYDCIGPDDQALAEYGVVRHPEYDRNNLIRTDGLGAARIWHRCVLEELGGFDEENLGSYGEDYDLALKISEKYDILRIPYVLYHYRMNHKRAEEKTDYLMRHAKKTFARRSVIMRRRLINGASGEDGTP